MDCYLGQLMLCSFPVVPQGFLPCDGRLLSIRDNQALYSLLGTTFGGDGVNNFAIPDLRGRAAQGAGPSNRLGEKAGTENVAVTLSQCPQHTHALKATTASDSGGPAGALFAGSGTANAWATPASSPVVTMQADAMRSAGAGQVHENRQPFLVMSWIIATRGIYPTRD